MPHMIFVCHSWLGYCKKARVGEATLKITQHWKQLSYRPGEVMNQTKATLGGGGYSVKILLGGACFSPFLTPSLELR